jgi:hypothetical protein
MTAPSADLYSELFPFDISSQNLLIRRTFRGAVTEPFLTAVWRHFLIIAPRAKRTIRDASDWIAILKASRLSFARLQQEFPDRYVQFRQQKNHGVIMQRVAEVFMHIAQGMDRNVLDTFLLVLCHFVDDSTAPAYIESLCQIVPRIFHQILKESTRNTDNSPSAILMDSNYVLHDVYACVTFVMSFLQRFFVSETSRSACRELYMQISLVIRTINPGIDSSALAGQIPAIVPLYHSLFQRYFESEADLLQIWTTIFSSAGDPAILHMFYACVFASSGVAVPDVPSLPMLFYRVQIGRWSLGVDEIAEGRILVEASEAIDKLIAMMSEKDTRVRRMVVKYQVGQLIKISRGLAHPQELIPIEMLQSRIRRISIS